MHGTKTKTEVPNLEQSGHPAKKKKNTNIRTIVK